MDLHVCIKVDDDAVNKIARIITETVKKVTEIQQAGEVQQPSAAVQPAPDPSRASVPAAAPTTPYSAQIAQATQQPVQTMNGQRPATQQPVPSQQPASQQQSVPSQQPASQQQAVPPVQPAIPTASRTYTLDELAGAAMVLMDRGMQAQLQELLAGYGVEALPMLPPEQYGNFATALRGMGAQI